MTSSLNRRLVRLEANLRPDPERCRTCGLPYIRLPVPIGLVEAITRRVINGEDAQVPRLCLCTPCCAAGAHIAQLSHGLPIGEGTTWLV